MSRCGLLDLGSELATADLQPALGRLGVLVYGITN
jgi:hypothetical protein